MWLTDRETNVQRRDMAEKHDQDRLCLRHFDFEKSRLVVKNASCGSSKVCFLHRRGAHFQKSQGKSNRKVKNLVKMMLGTSKITHNGIAYIKVSLQ